MERMMLATAVGGEETLVSLTNPLRKGTLSSGGL
jgi:hypothetical protein